MLNIDDLWKDTLQGTGGRHSLAMLILNAFEINSTKDISEEKRFEPLLDIFAGYYSPNHKYYDFFDQIELSLIKNLSPLNLLEFHNLVRDILSQYSSREHNTDTLISILNIAFISDTGGIDDVLWKIWNSIRKNAGSSAFLVEVFRYIVVLPHNNVSNWIIDDLLGSPKEFDPNLAPFILLKRGADDLYALPELINHLSKRIVWTDFFDSYDTKMLVHQLIKKTSVGIITNILKDLEPRSFWFLKGLSALAYINFVPKYNTPNDETFEIALEYVTKKESIRYEVPLNSKLEYEIRNSILDTKLIEISKLIETRENNLSEDNNNLLEKARRSFVIMDNYVNEDRVRYELPKVAA